MDVSVIITNQKKGEVRQWDCFGKKRKRADTTRKTKNLCFGAVSAQGSRWQDFRIFIPEALRKSC